MAALPRRTANQLHAQYVLESISTGAVCAFAMECYEHGIITSEMAGGLDLSWGNADAMVALIHMIGRREGLGDLLAEGVKRAAATLGKGKGHPLGALGLIEPLDPMTLDAKKVRAFFVTQQVWSAYNSVGMCDFVGAPLDALQLQPMIDYINSVTGWNMSLYELMKVGARIDPAEFLAARTTYYEMAGWDPQTGKPTDAKLAELGIS